MASDDRRSVDSLLGHPLQEDQQIYTFAFKPGVIPDDETRQRALPSMQRTFAATQQHAQQQGVTDDDIDAAVNEATA